jgi:serine/threonine protein kinase
MPEYPLLDPPRTSDHAATTDEPHVTAHRAGGVGILAGVSNHAERYQLSEEISRGGMGVVCRAMDTVLGREVAVKVLQERYAPDSAAVRRFADEARITGQLQHPNIPAVHDLGVLPDGRPFLAMKLIKGETLDELLKHRSDATDDRGRFLAAFERVCQAVAYAHAHDVIHRDLKPANVMVGAFGEVQVMDWGLAKVLGARPEEQTDSDKTTAPTMVRSLRESDELFTQAGSVLGTPAFMPPEQAAGAVSAIDRRSDVFGLGAVLAVVLTGQPPFVSDTSESTRVKAAQGDVQECFTRLDSCGADPGLVALCRRCLSPRPEDRPTDADEVAKAVAALRGAAEERARRAELDRVQAEGQVRETEARAAAQRQRRRTLLIASGIIVLVLLSGLTVSLWQMQRAMHFLSAEQEARRDEAKAREQAFVALRSMTAEVVERRFAQGAVLSEDDRAFLRGIIAQFDAFAAIKGDDADSRAVRAEGRYRVATMRWRLGELSEAERDYNQAVATQKQLVAEFPSRPEFRQDLAKTLSYRGILQSETRQFDAAVNDFDEALTIRERLAVDFPNRTEFRDELAGSHNNRGRLRYHMGRPKEARLDYDQAVNIFEQLVAEFPARPEFRHNSAKSHIGRGILMNNMGRLKESEQDYNQAVILLTQLSKDFSSRLEFRQDLATSHNNRGVLLSGADRLEEAAKDFDEALTIRERLAADFPNRPELRYDFASTCVNLADLHLQNGNWSAAKRQLLAGGPHLLAALKANPRHPDYRLFYRNHLGALTVAHAGLLKREDAVRTAETCRDLGWNPSADAYDAARFLSGCVPVVAKHDKLDPPQRMEAAQYYGDAAMKLLRDAVSKGYKDIAHMKKDADFDPLRQRDDFQKLIAELEGKGK